MTNLAEETRDSLVILAHGISVAVRVQGEGDPLLLINGFTRSLDNWVPFVDGLSARMVISFDAPGVGDSPVPKLPLSIAHLADVAASVLDHLGVSSADVLGYSYGGFVAQQMAVSHPDRIRRLVLVSTSCGLGSTIGKLDPLDRAVLGKGATQWPHVVGALWNSLAFATWSSISFLGGVASPTLVVCGSDDTVAPPANSRSLAQRIPDATLVMIEGGHDLQLADPATRLARVVDRFLVPNDTAPHSTATKDVALSKEMI